MNAFLTYILITTIALHYHVIALQCDVGREAQCGLTGVAQIEGRKARRRSRDARHGANCRAQRGPRNARCGVGSGTLGAALNAGATRNEGARGEDDFPVGRIAFQDATRVTGREGESVPQWRGCLPED
jgi:hypothetical protein